MKPLIIALAFPLLLSGTSVEAQESTTPQLVEIAQDFVAVSVNGRAVKLGPGDRTGRWAGQTTRFLTHRIAVSNTPHESLTIRLSKSEAEM